jgi:hypothetical protein
MNSNPLKELKSLKRRYDGVSPKFVAGVELSNGTTVMYGFLVEYEDGYLARREGGRMDYIFKSNISCIRIDNLMDAFPEKVSVKAPGPKNIAQEAA